MNDEPFDEAHNVNIPSPGLEEMAVDECWRLLKAHDVGRLVVVVGHQPDIFPVNYRIDGDSIVIRTAPGNKLAAAVMGGLVAFEIDAFNSDRHEGWSVVVHGTATEPSSVEATMHIDDLGLEPWAAGDKMRHIRITPTEVTGRRLSAAPASPDGAGTN